MVDKDPMNITIRTATLDDLPVLLDFEQKIILAERPFDPTLKESDVSYYDLKDHILQPDAEVVVAVDGHIIIGSGFARIEKAKPFVNHQEYGHLGFMYVAPNYRGMGVNAMIIEHLKNWCFGKGLKEISLEVYTENMPAIRAYEKIGFKPLIMKMRFTE